MMLINRFILKEMVLFRFASFVFDEASGLVEGDKPISLSPLQHRLLLIFCRNPNTLLSKSDLIEAVWNHTFVSEVSLARTVHELRQRLGGGQSAKQLIVSVYGRGYVFQPQGCSSAPSCQAPQLSAPSSSPLLIGAVS